MLGRTHALSGVTAGLAVAPLVGVAGLPETVVFAVVTAGYALLPDLDHDRSTASRFLGPVTRLIAELLQLLSRWVYRLTAGPKDEDHRGEHRHLTHTGLFAAGAGGLAAWSGGLSPWVVAGIAAFGVLLAGDRLGDWVLPVVAVAGLVWWVAHRHDLAGALDLSGTVGIAVALGCLTHDLGDMLTEHGLPLLWPLPIRGETWYEIRPPALVRFRTGGPGEWLVFAALVGLLGWQGYQLGFAALR